MNELKQTGLSKRDKRLSEASTKARRAQSEYELRTKTRTRACADVAIILAEWRCAHPLQTTDELEVIALQLHDLRIKSDDAEVLLSDGNSEVRISR